MKKIFLFTLIVGPFLQAQEKVSFKDLWSQIQNNSVALKSVQTAGEAAKAEESKANRHWLPSIYAGAKVFQTNDPGTVLFGYLSQQKIEATDFNPATLNDPETSDYTAAMIGAQLPIYEGGMKQNLSKYYEAQGESQSLQASQLQVEIFSQAKKAYYRIAFLNDQLKKLNEQNQILEKKLKGYQLGQKSNLMGYSGLLGLKNLKNKITGMIDKDQVELKAQYEILKALGFEKNEWEPMAQLATNDLIGSFQFQNTQDPSFKLKAMQLQVQGYHFAAQAEKARFLPHVGLFAESQIFKGGRDQGDSYVVGAYLKWSLFDPNNFGAYGVASLKQQAFKYQSEALKLQEDAEKKSLEEVTKNLESQMKLLDDSQALLKEQVQVTDSLYRNGSLNVLQFLEVLHRNIEVIEKVTELKTMFVEQKLNLLQKQNLDLNQLK